MLPCPESGPFLVVHCDACIHKVHHSRFQPETDSELFLALFLWIGFFRTFKIARRPGNYLLWLAEFDIPARQHSCFSNASGKTLRRSHELGILPSD